MCTIWARGWNSHTIKWRAKGEWVAFLLSYNYTSVCVTWGCNHRCTYKAGSVFFSSWFWLSKAFQMQSSTPSHWVTSCSFGFGFLLFAITSSLISFYFNFVFQPQAPPLLVPPSQKKNKPKKRRQKFNIMQDMRGFLISDALCCYH